MAKVTVKVQQRGGEKLRRLLREAAKRRDTTVEVGFFSTAKYDDKRGTPVAAVAAWNEFGTETIPERPFFRRALAEVEDGVTKIVKAGIDTEKMVVDDRLAGRVGAYVAGQIQESITALKYPPNAPETVARKRKKLHGKKPKGPSKGVENPLIDTGHMRNSVGWSVDGGAVQYPKTQMD